MNVSDFDFDLPARCIAQAPAPRRDHARLMLLDRVGERIEHRRFDDLVRLLDPGDLLVLNDTRVLPARLHGRKSTGGRVELLLLEALDANDGWRCMMRSSRPVSAGTTIEFADGLACKVEAVSGERYDIRFAAPDGEAARRLEEQGRMPLPPYIRRDAGGDPGVDDRERYQTVFARRRGAVAAPTAGLHFTPELLRSLEGHGVRVATLTLHVGSGTFQPLRVERVEEHALHDEWFELPPALSVEVSRARAAGRRVVAVGTTVLRTLEHCADDDGSVHPGSGRCGLFIYPGYRFRTVDSLITNFHLPRSSLILLVAALIGRERLLSAYRTAIDQGYRFYSYGDAMFVRSS